MMVAKLATAAALALAGFGVLAGMVESDIMLAAAGLSSLFVAALFWTLAEIGERVGTAALPVAEVLAKPSPAPDAGPATVVAFDETGAPDLAALEKKLAAKRGY